MTGVNRVFPRTKIVLVFSTEELFTWSNASLSVSCCFCSKIGALLSFRRLILHISPIAWGNWKFAYFRVMPFYARSNSEQRKYYFGKSTFIEFKMFHFCKHNTSNYILPRPKKVVLCGRLKNNAFFKSNKIRTFFLWLPDINEIKYKVKFY